MKRPGMFDKLCCIAFAAICGGMIVHGIDTNSAAPFFVGWICLPISLIMLRTGE